MTRTPRKPVGTTGPLHLTSKGAEFQKLAFPNTKEGIELYIARSFAASPVPGGLLVQAIQQNAQDDLDFAVGTSLGSLLMELMEIAPLEHLRGSYEAAPSAYRPYDFARYIHTKVLGKSRRYAGADRPRMLLLLYVTDWSFVLSDTVISLLQYWLHTEPHVFEFVFAHHPVTTGFGFTNLLHPTPAALWSEFNPDTLKNNVVHNLSPLKWQHRGGGEA